MCPPNSLPRYLRKERCDAHYALWLFLHGDKKLEVKCLPVVDRLTATNSRMTCVSLAPHFDLGFAQEQLATFPTEPDTPAREISVLLDLNARIEAAENSPELEALLASVASHCFHPDNRFGANWLRAKILRKLALPQQAFALYCAELNDVFNRGGEKVFEDVLMREGSFTLAQTGDISPEGLRQELADNLWFAADCILLSANQLSAAQGMFLSCLRRAPHTERLYEKLIYGFIRLAQWQDALDYAKTCAERRLFTPLVLKLAAQACDALGCPEEMICFDEMLPKGA